MKNGGQGLSGQSKSAPHFQSRVFFPAVFFWFPRQVICCYKHVKKMPSEGLASKNPIVTGLFFVFLAMLKCQGFDDEIWDIKSVMFFLRGAAFKDVFFAAIHLLAPNWDHANVFFFLELNKNNGWQWARRICKSCVQGIKTLPFLPFRRLSANNLQWESRRQSLKLVGRVVKCRIFVAGICNFMSYECNQHVIEGVHRHIDIDIRR